MLSLDKLYYRSIIFGFMYYVVSNALPSRQWFRAEIVLERNGIEKLYLYLTVWNKKRVMSGHLQYKLLERSQI